MFKLYDVVDGECIRDHFKGEVVTVSSLVAACKLAESYERTRGHEVQVVQVQ